MKADVEDIYALAPMQTGMLFQSLYAPHEGSYVEQSVLDLEGPVNSEAFWRAWQLVVDRHPSLRTSFHWRSMRSPVQVVHRTTAIDRAEEDLRHLSADAKDAHIRAALDAERLENFDLERTPLIRLTLYRVDDAAYRLTMRMSHLIVDGWSIGVMCTEFMTAYRKLWAGEQPELAPAPAFRPYVEWWRSRDAATSGDYWKQVLDGYRPVGRMGETPAPADRSDALSHAAVQTTAPDLVADLHEFSRRHQVSRHSLIQAAWAAVLATGTDALDVVAGTTFAHRPPTISEVEGIVGCMVATVPVRTALDTSRPVLEWLGEVQEAIVGAREHLGISLTEIQEHSSVPRSAVLFESIVEFLNVPLPAFDLGETGLRYAGYAMDSRPHVPLSLLVLPGDDMPMRLVFDTRLFTETTARAVLDATVRAAGAIVAADRRTVGDVLQGVGFVPQMTTPIQVSSPETAARTEPNSETERQLADVMVEILGVTWVGPEDDLLELGMHSLLGTQVANRIAGVFDVEVPLRTLFEHPTVAEIAYEIEQTRAGHGSMGEAPPSAGRAATLDADELRSHITLDEEITASAPRREGMPQTYLLTGATGTVGSEVLAALLRETDATIYCLLRGRSEESRVRLRDALSSLPGGDELDLGRVTIVAGSLAKPLFGLDRPAFDALGESVDVIIHAGASVNFLPPLRRLAPTNVGGCRETLRLAATGRPSVVHHISSTAVFGAWVPGGEHYDERPLSLEPPLLDNGYEQSKWVAEHVMALGRERGIPVTVQRLGRMAGNSTTGAWKLGDVLSEVIRACVLLGMVPDTGSELDLTPVDRAAAAVCQIAVSPTAADETFHIVNRHRFSLPVLAAAMEAEHYPVRTVPVEEWLAELTAMAERDDDAKWGMILEIARPWAESVDAGLREGTYACAVAGARSDVIAAGTPVDVDLIRTYLRHFASVEFIPTRVLL